ncbi:MYB DNA-binding domain-containing protein [Paracoccidioides lutzii Pb01]|uniref:MYB DNA-binding domain-containing protein n=1 Tax=Paracoccidioides lutzii (strain ATCC MYA-826 / Pb01) TaxID=502779 RepID=C1H7Q4_PARBA|nr:MYB DNA-binding domain-containing protein [Paracoccidioides lutzii Pb01]EEH36377.2 MYB DNA-binding domain-containing protein [Paracoccidioides lutzii Pb01]
MAIDLEVAQPRSRACLFSPCYPSKVLLAWTNCIPTLYSAATILWFQKSPFSIFDYECQCRCTTVTLADPYRDYQIDYSTQEQSKAQEQQSQLVYHTNQHSPQSLHHGARPDVGFLSGGQHHQSFQPQQQQSSHHHQQQTPQQQQQHGQPGAVALSSAGSHNAVRDIQPPVLLPAQMVAPQLPPHFNTGALQLPSYASKRHGTKRARIDDGPGESGDDHTTGISLSMLSDASHGDEPQSTDMLLSTQSDPSSHHQPPSQHDYQSASSLHHQQHHHHHRLPSQATLAGAQRSDADLTSPGGVSGPPSVVGQPGMPDPAPRPRGPKLKFTPEEDALLVELKENKNLTWKQIADFFPGRTSGTLQVRYCTKLKAKATVWTDETVQRLRNAIHEYENDRWRVIANKVGNGFSPAACRDKATEF